MKNKRKKFVGIAKVKQYGSFTFVKYRFNDIENFIRWLNQNYSALYVNIYNNREPNKGLQIAYWTNKQGLIYTI